MEIKLIKIVPYSSDYRGFIGQDEPTGARIIEIKIGRSTSEEGIR